MKMNVLMDEKKEELVPEEQTPAKHGFRRFLIFSLTLIVVLAVVVAAAYRDGTGFDVLRRYLTYGKAEKESGAATYTYDAGASNRFAALGSSLVVLSDTTLQVLDGGTTVYSTPVKMTAPALAVGGGCAVAYDVGGTQLILVNGSGELLNLTADESEPFVSATLNAKGWLAVTSEKKNYKGAVSVYNENRDLVFTYNASDRFVTNAYVSDDCRDLAAVTLGQKDSVFVSNIVLYHLSATEPYADGSVSDGLVISLGELSGKLAAVADTGLNFLDSSGETVGAYDYTGEYLREYQLGGDGFAALVLDRYRSGNVGRLVTVGNDGKEIASLDVTDEILSVSAAGRYVGVLYADRLAVYTENLEEYASLSGTDYAKEVLMRSDGSALLVSSDRASLFLP